MALYPEMLGAASQTPLEISQRRGARGQGYGTGGGPGGPGGSSGMGLNSLFLAALTGLLQGQGGGGGSAPILDDRFSTMPPGGGAFNPPIRGGPITMAFPPGATPAPRPAPTNPARGGGQQPQPSTNPRYASSTGHRNRYK